MREFETFLVKRMLESALVCSACLSLLFEPICLPCGNCVCKRCFRQPHHKGDLLVSFLRILVHDIVSWNLYMTFVQAICTRNCTTYNRNAQLSENPLRARLTLYRILDPIMNAKSLNWWELTLALFALVENGIGLVKKKQTLSSCICSRASFQKKQRPWHWSNRRMNGSKSGGILRQCVSCISESLLIHPTFLSKNKRQRDWIRENRWKMIQMLY